MALEQRDTEKLNFIADELQYWIKRSEATKPEDIVIAPVWPTKGVLENWIKVLKGQDI